MIDSDQGAIPASLVAALAPGTGAATMDDLWATLLATCVEQVPAATAGSVLERANDGELRFVASVGYEHDALASLRLSPSALRPSHRDGVIVGSRLDLRRLTAEQRDVLLEASHGVEPASILSVAIRPGGRLTGYLQLDAFEEDAFDDGDVRGAVAMAELVAARVDRWHLEQALQRAHREARRHATHDPLSGLPSRPLVIDRLGQALARDQRAARSTALLMVELRDLRTINGTYGHGTGDDLIRFVAARLAEAVREMDTVGHLGAGEFAVVAGNIETPADAESLVERIEAIAETPYEANDVSIRPRLAIGVALAPSDAAGLPDLLRNGQRALGRAKREPERPVAWFVHDVDQEQRERSRLSEELRDALLGSQGVWVAFQPILRLSDGACLGIEALARWDRRDGDGARVPPSLFGPLTEELGLTHLLSSRVYERAFDVFRNLDPFRAGAVWRLALNVSATQLQSDELARQLEALASRYGVPAEEIDLEVPAAVVFGAEGEALQRLRSLRQLGCRVVVDDFAAHPDEIDRLEGMPIDVLKIHPHWTTALDDDLAKRRVASIVSAAERLDLDVIAEGVESADQGRALADAGVEAVQGFAAAPPMHAAALLAWLATRSPSA